MLNTIPSASLFPPHCSLMGHYYDWTWKRREVVHSGKEAQLCLTGLYLLLKSSEVRVNVLNQQGINSTKLHNRLGESPSHFVFLIICKYIL